MQVSVETTTGLERKVTVGIPAETIDSAVDKKLAEAAKQVRIDGFRPGKVPLREVRRRYGKSIREEVIGEAVSNSFYDAVTKESLNPAGYPQIERTKDVPGEDLEFVATFEVFPEVSVSGLDQISVVRPLVELTDADIEATIDKLRAQKATYKEVERSAQDNDRVTIDFLGTLDGEAFDGGAAEGQTLVLGSGSMIPGFEDGILGMAAGEEKMIDVTFPEEYHAENLKGKAAQFKINVHKVEEQELPAVDEEFVKHFTETDSSVEDFRNEVRKNMERELNSAIKSKVKTAVMDGVLANNEVEAPKALIDKEIDRERQQMAQQFGQGGNFNPASLPAELFEDKATRAVKLALVLGELVREKDIKADPSRVRSTIEELAEPYENPEQVVGWYYENQEMLKQIESMVLEDQVVDLILEQASVTDESMSYSDLMEQKRS